MVSTFNACVSKLEHPLEDKLMNVCADCCAYRYVNVNHVSYYCFSLTRLLLLLL